MKTFYRTWLDYVLDLDYDIFTSSQAPKLLCGICIDSVKESRIFKSECNHSFCKKCISKYVTIQRKEKVVKLNCPDPGCSVELKPENLQSMFPKKFIVEWESANCASSIDSKEKLYCPYKNCSLLLVNDEADSVTSCECPSCHRLFCAKCKVPWHADMNCRQFQKSKIGGEKQWDRNFLVLAKREKWQRCPKCSMHVEKTYGCLHMRCRLYFIIISYPL
jgi:E3 ubiquitin-protein ligase RNF144